MQSGNSSYILWITENYFPNTGGMAQSCDRIVQGLRDRGLNIGLVHFRATKSSVKMKTVNHGFNMVVPVNEDEAHAYNLLYNFLINPGFKYEFSHIIAFGGYLPILGAPIISRLLNIPLIILLRGNDFDVALYSPRKRDMLFYALNTSRTICTVSKDQSDKVQKLYPHPDIRYIPNGLDVASWSPHKSEQEMAADWKQKHVPADKKVIGIFGQLKPKKGIDSFIDAIIRSGHAESLFLLITGDIYPEFSERLEVSGIQYHISPFIDRYELLSWYPACDAIAIPSFYDGMPNVLLEAGALGIPIISANTGGMKDILVEGENGFLFHPGDEEGCAMAIKRFINCGTATLSKMGQNIKQLIVNQYNGNIEVEQYLKIFD